jgi:hypothetical protein
MGILAFYHASAIARVIRVSTVNLWPTGRFPTFVALLFPIAPPIVLAIWRLDTGVESGRYRCDAGGPERLRCRARAHARFHVALTMASALCFGGRWFFVKGEKMSYHSSRNQIFAEFCAVCDVPSHGLFALAVYLLQSLLATDILC